MANNCGNCDANARRAAELQAENTQLQIENRRLSDRLSDLRGDVTFVVGQIDDETTQPTMAKAKLIAAVRDRLAFAAAGAR